MDQLDDTQQFVTRLVQWRAAQAAGYLVTRGPERVPEVSELRSSLLALGVKDLRYFDEGLDCIQYAQAPRAAIVLGWTGLIDLLQTKVGRDNFASLNAILNVGFHGVYKSAGKIKDRNELIKYFDDALLLEAGRKLTFYNQHVSTQLNAMRDERNNCAHVQEYAVNVRIALGFYAHLVEFLPYVL
jgi:hypothetical protein